VQAPFQRLANGHGEQASRATRVVMVCLVVVGCGEEARAQELLGVGIAVVAESGRSAKWVLDLARH